MCRKREPIQYIILCKVQNLILYMHPICSFSIIAVTVIFMYNCNSRSVSIWSHLVFSCNHGSTVMLRNIAFRLQYESFPSQSLVVSPYYVNAVCTSSHPAHVRIGRVSLLYNCVRCIWMAPNLSTLEYLSAFQFLSESQVCMCPGISNAVWAMIFSPSLRALLTGYSSATTMVSRSPD